MRGSKQSAYVSPTCTPRAGLGALTTRPHEAAWAGGGGDKQPAPPLHGCKGTMYVFPPTSLQGLLWQRQHVGPGLRSHLSDPLLWKQGPVS